MKEYLSLDATCIIGVNGTIVYVNEPFLTLFEVSEQILSFMNIQDLIYDPILRKSIKNLSDLPFMEFNFVTPNSKVFSSFISISKIPNTDLRVLSIKSISKTFSSKRAVTSFRRYVDRQIALSCFQLENNQLIPIHSLNMDLFDDNPSFLINLGMEIYDSISGRIQDLDKFTGLLKPIKLKFQNFNAISYIFQLLVPGNLVDKDIIDYVTETFLLVIFYPTALSSLFSDQKKLKNSFNEHISQIHNPKEITTKFLDEIKQKVILNFDSHNIKDLDEFDIAIHNFFVLTQNLVTFNVPLSEAIDLLTNFCINYFKFEGINIIQYHLDEYNVLNSKGNLEISGSFYLEVKSIYEKFLIPKSLNSAEIINHGDLVYIPINNKEKNIIFGLMQIKPKLTTKNVGENEKFLLIASEIGKLLEHHQLEDKLLLIQKLTDELLHVPDVKSLFETLARFVQQVFKNEFKLFATLLYNPETESLDFITQRGYPSDFNVKSIALNSQSSVIATSARDKRILNISNVKDVDFYLKGDNSVQSELALPMIYNNQLIGVLNVESPRINAFSEYFHVPLMEIIRDLSISTYLRLSILKKIGNLNLKIT